MLKKKLGILLFILLFVFLVGLSSNCYAYEHILTDSDIRTICDNNFGANSVWTDLFYDKIKALKDEFYSYNYDLIIINMYSSSYHQVDVFGTTSSRIAGVNNLNNKNYMQIIMQGNGIKASILQNGYNAVRVDRSGLSSPNTYPVGSGSQNRSNYLLYTNDLGSSGLGPYQNLSWLEFIEPKIFRIDLNTDNNTNYVNFNNLNNDSTLDLTNVPILYDSNFGTFLDDTYIFLTSEFLDFWFWNGSYWQYKLLFLNSANIDDSLLIKSNQYLNVNYSINDNVETYSLSIKDLYKFKNVLFHFQVMNNENDSADCYFVFADDNTTILNNEIDTSNLGSNYLNQFNDIDNMINNNNNTNEIISVITDTPKSGDDIDFNTEFIDIDIADPTINFFEFILNGISGIFLTNEEVVLTIYLPYITGNNTYILSSDFFVLTGPLCMIINFIWLYIVLIPIVNEIRKLINAIKVGNSSTFIKNVAYGLNLEDLL